MPDDRTDALPFQGVELKQLDHIRFDNFVVGCRLSEYQFYMFWPNLNTHSGLICTLFGFSRLGCSNTDWQFPNRIPDNPLILIMFRYRRSSKNIVSP